MGRRVKEGFERVLVGRVDDMLDSGMFEELTEFFDSDELLRNDDRVGLRKAIGERSFKKGLEALKKKERGVCGNGKSGSLSLTMVRECSGVCTMRPNDTRLSHHDSLRLRA
ncbi:hypothetical protein FCV25MIE_33946 [Fagus crenata]